MVKPYVVNEELGSPNRILKMCSILLTKAQFVPEFMAFAADALVDHHANITSCDVHVSEVKDFALLCKDLDVVRILHLIMNVRIG